EVLTNRRPHASKTRERSEDLGRLVGEMADDDVGVAHRPERSETLDDLVHRTRNERLPTEPAVSAGERGLEDRRGLARRLADLAREEPADDRERFLERRRARRQARAHRGELALVVAEAALEDEASPRERRQRPHLLRHENRIPERQEEEAAGGPVSPLGEQSP